MNKRFLVFVWVLLLHAASTRAQGGKVFDNLAPGISACGPFVKHLSLATSLLIRCGGILRG